MKKLTISFVRKKFGKEGYTLLTDEYINAHQKLEYICPINHTGYIRWNNWQKGQRCAECAKVKKHTIEFIKKQFEKEGYNLLTKKYINNEQKLEYTCSEGHDGAIRWGNWQQGQRCQKCYFENNKGENSPHWNSNLTDEERKIKRNYPEYIEWKKGVFENANYICEVCGQVGGNLEVHHKNSYAVNPEQRIALSNGACVCKNCHKDFHHQYGYCCIEEQFEEFKTKKSL